MNAQVGLLVMQAVVAMMGALMSPDSTLLCSCVVFGFPLELAAESDGPPSATRPPLSLFLSVISRDVHERSTQLGYAHVPLPGRAGGDVRNAGAWRLAEGRADALRRFFVGGRRVCVQPAQKPR